MNSACLHGLCKSIWAVCFKEKPVNIKTVYAVRRVYISMMNFAARITRCCRKRTRRPVSTSICAVRVSTDAKAERCSGSQGEKKAHDCTHDSAAT